MLYTAMSARVPCACRRQLADRHQQPLLREQIKTTQLMRDRDTDKFKGFAFVEFATVGDLQQALDVSGCVSVIAPFSNDQYHSAIAHRSACNDPGCPR